MNKLTKSIKPRIAHLNGEQKIQSLALSYGAQTLIVDHHAIPQFTNMPL